jgi:hypothetical protein
VWACSGGMESTCVDNLRSERLKESRGFENRAVFMAQALISMSLAFSPTSPPASAPS